MGFRSGRRIDFMLVVVTASRSRDAHWGLEKLGGIGLDLKLGDLPPAALPMETHQR